MRPFTKRVVYCLRDAEKDLKAKEVAERTGLKHGRVLKILRKHENRYFESEQRVGRRRRNTVRVWRSIDES